MVVVVGGHSRNIGKTAVVCGIIRGLPEMNWTAIKITQYGHGVCSKNGEPCPCSDPAHPIAISQEEGYRPETDSGRFLVAGAAKAFWVRTPAGRLNEALPRLRRLLAAEDNVVMESNSILRFLRPDFCALVLDGAVADFKPTSLRFMDRADALVLTSNAKLQWSAVPRSLLEGKPAYQALAPHYENAELLNAILRKAEANAGHSAR